MIEPAQKNPARIRGGAESTEANLVSVLQSGQVKATAAPVREMRRGFPRAVEPFPGRALAIRGAKTERDLARACVRYAAALMMLRKLAGQAPDLACEVVAGSVAQHVRQCDVRPRPSSRQIARAVEAAFAFAERVAGEVGAWA
jgi:hypothetical protein